MDTRELVVNMLNEIIDKQQLSHVVQKRLLDNCPDMSKQDRSFVTELVNGTLERLITIDLIIAKFSSVKPQRIKPFIMNVLRVGTYQIMFLDRVPASAACNEAVKLTKKRGLNGLSGYVNGVLRNIAREKESLFAPPEKSDKITRLMYLYSTPKWLAKQLVDQYGDETESILKAQFEKNSTGIRVNESLGINATEAAEMLTAEGIQVKKGFYFKNALRISGYDKLDTIKLFINGNIIIQDESSMLVAMSAGIKNGDNIIDVCAAPGGKSIHAADILAGTGHVEARDLTDYKVNLIESNINRCGFKNITAVKSDACIYDEKSEKSADVVIADLPCSGLGVLNKKPDIKLNMTPEKEKELIVLQRKILNNAVRYVKPGGVFIYSTCTLNKNENNSNRDYIRDVLGLKPDSLEGLLPDGFGDSSIKEGYLQLIPGRHGTDGFYVARFVAV